MIFTTSLSVTVTPPLDGLAVSIALPAPTYSNEWEEAICKLCLEKYAVLPNPTSLFRFWTKVTVEIPFEGNVASSTVYNIGAVIAVPSAVVPPPTGAANVIDGGESVVYWNPVVMMLTPVTSPCALILPVNCAAIAFPGPVGWVTVIAGAVEYPEPGFVIVTPWTEKYFSLKYIDCPL